MATEPIPWGTAGCSCPPDPDDPEGYLHLTGCPATVTRKAARKEAASNSNGPARTSPEGNDCAERGCTWDIHARCWTKHRKRPPCPNDPEKPAKAPPKKRKLRPDDIGGMLVEVGKAAANDPRLTDVDRDVYFAVFGRAHGLTETEVTATRRWVEAVTGHPYSQCRTALKRLERFGYLKRITREEVKRQKLSNWLASHTFEDGRLPGIYRMSLNPPRWDDVADYAAPLDDGWRDRVDALLSA